MRYSPIRRRQRRAARIALYGSLAISTTLLVLLAYIAVRLSLLDFQGVWEERDYENLPAVKLLQEYIRIDTSQTTGSEMAGAEYLAHHLEEAGIPVQIERIGDKGANLWAIIEGEDPRALVLHSHIDVTPIARPEEWNYPPFAGEIDLPWIFGRGAFDMKSVTVAQLLAMIDLQESGIRPQRSLIFLATGDEETGSNLGTRWILANHPELVDRFWAVATEGGVVEAVTREEVKYWGIESTQRRLLPIVACSPSRERLEALREDLKTWGQPRDGLQITPELREFFQSYGRTRGFGRTRDFLAHPERFLTDPFRLRRVPLYLRSLIRSEAFAGDIEEHDSGEFRMPIDVQLLPGADPESTIHRLLPPHLTAGVAISIGEPEGSQSGSPADHPVFLAAVDAVHEHHPEVTVGPYFQPWSVTDARFFRLHGIPSFGFSPFLILTTDTLQVDAPNERIALPGFVEGVEIYNTFVRRALH